MLQGKIPQQAEKYAKKRDHRKVWHRIVMVLACIVVFCTTYALILPAITMERAPSCGFEEHQHTEGCYGAKQICGFDDSQTAAHTHLESCYEHQQILVCGREESLGHAHSDSCIYTEQTLICAQEHEHAPECFTSSSTYVCGMAEGEGAHVHSQECYETNDSLICTIPEQAPHVHTDACFETVLVCQREEHLHSDACYPSSAEETTEATEVTTEATTEATEETTEATEETTEVTEETTEATEEETQPEEFEVPELEPYVIAASFTDTVYDAAAGHFDTVMNVSFRIPVSVISVGELYECNYQLPGNLSPRADLMWSASPFHFGTVLSGSAARAGVFTFTYEGNHCLCVLNFDRNAVSGDVVEGNLRFDAEISPSALREDGTILMILSNGVGVSIPAPEMPSPETEPTEMTTEATEETNEATEETTEATEETTEAAEETTEATEETTEATEETTEAAEETTEATEETTEETNEPSGENIKDSIKDTLKDILSDKLPLGGLDMGASNFNMTETSDEETSASDETEATEESTDDGGIMPLADAPLPVTKISGNDTKYDPTTDKFTTDVRIDFQFTAATGKPTAGTVYTYTYPAGVVIPDDVVNASAKILMDGDKEAGTYDFIKVGDRYCVQIVFNEKYVQEAGDTVTGYVQFEGTFSQDQVNDKGEIVVGGDDAQLIIPGKDITYPKDETESYNISTSKSGTWERDGDNLVYTVYVRTTKGTPAPINLEDIITIPEGLTLGQPSVTVQKGTADYYYQSWNNTWGFTDNNNLQDVISGVTQSYANGKLTLTLPKLEVGENNNNGVNGQYYKITYTYHIDNQTDPIVFANNTVTVSAKDTTKGQTVTDSDGTTVRVDKDYSHTLDKYGQVASDKPGYIKWTVTVNRNQVNIAGATLTDQMLGLVQNASDITVYPADYATVNKNNDGKITGITFPAIIDGTNNNTFTITYYTPVEESWNGTTVTNTAIFDPDPTTPDDEKEVTSSVTVSGVQMNKRGQFNGATGKIDWTITVNAGKLDIAGATLTDDMFATLSEDNFTIQPSTGFSFTKDGEGKITGINFTEVADGKNTQPYTIKYSTDVTKNVDGSTSAVTNTAILSPGEGKGGNPIGSESTVKPDELQLTKSGSYTWDNKISWTITVNSSKLNIASAVLTDEMFSQLKTSVITIQKNGGGTPDPGEYTVAEDENGKITSITFNAIGGTGVNTNSYTITYSTDEPQEWNDKIVHNEAKLTLDGKEIPGTADVTVPADGSIAKSAGTGTISDNGATMTISWTVTLTVPKGGLPAGTTIVDDVTKNQWGNTNTNQWMTRSQITAWATNLTWTDDNGNSVGGNNTYTVPPEQVTFLASDGNTYTYKQISEYKAPAEGEGVNYEALTYTIFTIHFPESLIPPEGATKLTFSYSTTVNLSEMKDGANKFYNFVDAGGKKTDAEYTHYKPCVVKTDGNGTASETTVSNEGELTWKVKATVGQGNKKLTITDILPEGVTLESLYLTGWGSLNMVLSVAENGTISGTDSTNQYSVSGTYLNRVITLDIARKTEGNTIQSGAEFTLTVNCKVANAGSSSGTLTLTNKAEMRLDDATGSADPIDSSEQTQKWTYDRQVVDKSGSWNNDNRIMNYTVILNPDGTDLVEGVDTLTLVDTMTYTNLVYLQWPFSGTYNIDATLIQSSVELYEASWDETNGVWVAGAKVTGWSWTYAEKTGADGWNSNQATNTITATGIPDGKKLMFKYTYRISSNVPDEQDGKQVSFDLQFKNKAELEGTNHSDESSSSNWKWEHSSSSAGVTTDKSYTFYKVEAGNYNVSLAGATFSVYKYDTVSNAYGKEPVKTYYTNASGSFQITRQEKDASGNVTFTYDTNTLYKVVETAAPEGYWMPDVVNTYYFYFSSTEDTTHTLPTGLPADAVDLSSEAKTVYVENVKNTTEITVEKVWKDANGNVTTDSTQPITINLYQRTTKTSGSGGGDISGSGEAATVTATAQNNASVTASKITADAITVGSRIQIKVEIGYAIPSDWTWRPTINVTGMELGTVAGWTLKDSSANDHSTYTCEGTVTGNISIGISDESEGNIASITVTTLSQATTPTEPDSGSDTTTEEVYATIDLPYDGNWSHTFTNLPLKGLDKDNNTVSYYYYFQEAEVPDGYSVSYSNGSTGVQSGTVTVTNQKLPDTTSVTVRKVWKNANGDEITSDSDAYSTLPDSIQVYLTRRIGDGTPERVDSTGDTGTSAQPYTVTKESGWKLTVDNLLRTDGNGNSYTYSVEEVAVEGYDSVVTSNGTTITITNTKTTTPSDTSLTVEKVWKDTSGEAIAPGSASVTVNLYQVAVSNSSGGDSGGGETGGGGSGGTSVSYIIKSNGNDTDKKGTLSNVQVGSTVQVTVTMNYDCTYWQPTITLTGMTAQNDGSWTHGSNSVYTILAEITAENIVVDVGDSAEKFKVSIGGQTTATALSDSDTGSGVSATGGTCVKSVTLNSTNGWKQTFTDLPLTGTTNDGEVSYYYYFVEESVPEGYTVSYSNGSTGVQTGTVTVTNQKETTDTTVSVTVNKIWADAEGNTLAPAVQSVSYQLWRKAGENSQGEQVEQTEFTLTAEGKWTNTHSGLPAQDDSGNAYTYYVVETTTGYQVSYSTDGTNFTTAQSSGSAASGAISEGTITIRNSYDTVDISVEKQWFLGNTQMNDGYPLSEIEYALCRKAGESGAEETVLPGQKLNTENSWKATHSKLPKFAADGKTEYIYSVKETTTGGFETTYETAGDGTLVIKNTVPTTSITVKKVWLDSSKQAIDGNSESLPASITFYLTRTANGTTERVGSDGVIGENAQLYTLTKGNSWTMTIENLPLKDINGNTYSYSVEEVTVDGYIPAVSVNGTTITITNTQTTTPSGTSLTVKKVWKDANGGDLIPDSGYSVTVQLGRAKTSSNVLATSDVKNGKLTILDGVDMTNQNLFLRLTYRKEASTVDKTGWGYAGFRKNPVENWNADPDLTLNLPSNEPGEYSATLPLTQLAAIMGSDGIHFQIWEDHATFISMELIDTSLPEVGGEVTVDESYTPELVTLNESNNWQHTWYNLDSTSGDGSIFTYYVKEIKVKNGADNDITDMFNVTVDHGDQNSAIGPSGTVTVTNTLKSTYTLPETGGGGAKPYTLGGLLLCFTAGALLLYSHSSRRKEDFTSS